MALASSISLTGTEVDESFPDSILSNAGSGRDPFGYFTTGKQIFASYIDGQCAGSALM